MKRRIRSRAHAILLVLLTVPLQAQFSWSAETSAAPAPADPEKPSIVVLRDGGVLTGKVSPNQRGYVIQRGGTEIQVPAAKVLIACQSLEEAYVARRAEINPQSAAAHLALATWCLSYGLRSQAAHELTDAQQLEPNHPRLALLQRRLAADHTKAHSSVSRKPSAASPQAPSNDALEVTAVVYSAELSPSVVERFTRKVQPILVNSCTASGCHLRGGSQQFQLDRALLHGLANRRTTMHNLSATLALVDREQPQQSPLLTIPRQTHGGMRGPVFGPRQAAAFNHVVDWVALVTRREPAATEPLRTDEPNTGTDSITDLQTPPILRTDNEQMADAAVAIPQDQQPAVSTKRSIQYGARLEPWRPKDPFDPEILNRQQRSQPREEVTDGARRSQDERRKQ